MPATRRIQPLVQRTLAFDWSRAQPGAALLCLPALALALAAGAAAGRPRVGIMAAAGAFSVGLASFQQIRGSRRLPMLVAAVGICLSSWIGTLAGWSPGLTIALTALWGAACGVAWASGPGVSFVALQCFIWLVISSAYPARGTMALVRGSCALAGGLVQMLVVSTAWRVTGRVSGPASPVGAAIASTTRARAWRAAHAGLVLAVSMALARVVGLANSYWIPMTAAIVTRPAFRQTVERGVARTAGTLAGAAVATVAAWAVHPSPLALSGLVLLFAAASYVLVFVNYAAFVATLTGYVVFLLALAGAGEWTVVEHRALCTLMGAALAWLGHALFDGVERAVAAGQPASD
ncbi:MAG TPA: FUSC family protein [Polyangia bacterium]|nr:FUSC family protein [Polyangia bacterium]